VFQKRIHDLAGVADGFPVHSAQWSNACRPNLVRNFFNFVFHRAALAVGIRVLPSLPEVVPPAGRQ
jgi:hypothetical protein